MLAALAALRFVGSFQVTTQQSRVFTWGAANATVALGPSGSMIYVGSGGGAAIGGAIAAIAGVTWIPLAAAAIGLVALALTVLTTLSPRPVV